MHPKDFVEKWGVSRRELGDITGKTLETVNRWFSDRDPGREITTLLSSVDSSWTIREALDRLPSQIWAYYDLVKARRAVKGQNGSEEES